MESQKILTYTPSRLINCYYLGEEYIQILTFGGLIKLSDIGKKIWLMSNGKNTIGDMIQSIYQQLEENVSYSQTSSGVIHILKELRNRGVIIVNWDPLFKDEQTQEL